MLVTSFESRTSSTFRTRTISIRHLRHICYWLNKKYRTTPMSNVDPKCIILIKEIQSNETPLFQ